MRERIGLLLEPLDTLFFRGGRPFGEGLPGESELPSPQTLAGALRTHLLLLEGADLRAMRGHRTPGDAFRAASVEWLAEARFRGPWLAEHLDGEVRPLFPAPANLRLEAGGGSGPPLGLWPRRRPVPGWKPPVEGMLPLWSRAAARAKKRPELVTREGLAAWLRGESLQAKHIREIACCFDKEERTGIQIDPASSTAAEGQIYFTRHLRLKPGFAFYAEVELPAEKAGHFAEPAVLAWGGEGRRVVARRVPPLAWPEVAGSDRVSLLLLTPAFFQGGWIPDRWGEGRLLAAAVEGPWAASGWDLVRGGPKPVRFGVAAGSVYFLEGKGPDSVSLCGDAEDAAVGYGLFLKGSWNYADA